MKGKNILYTGQPGCGKSTLIEKIVNQTQKPLTGFITREIREEGGRVGFSIITMDGKEGVLAHQEIRSRYRVGKYGVNLAAIDQIAVPAMIPRSHDEWVVIDEIGKMECLSPLFRMTLIQVLDSLNFVLGSVALKGEPFIQNIKKRDDVLLIHVNERNRDQLVKEFFL